MSHRLRCFNPRPRAAGDGIPSAMAQQVISFNPRPRAAGDTKGRSLRTRRFRFNPRPRAAGDMRVRAAPSWITSFNPRPRAAGDWSLAMVTISAIVVSIHARARRATLGRPPPIGSTTPFQSTPARGGRLWAS